MRGGWDGGGRQGVQVLGGGRWRRGEGGGGGGGGGGLGAGGGGGGEGGGEVVRRFGCGWERVQFRLEEVGDGWHGGYPLSQI